MGSLLFGLYTVVMAALLLFSLGGLVPAPSEPAPQPRDLPEPITIFPDMEDFWAALGAESGGPVLPCEHDWQVVREDNPLTGGVRRCRACDQVSITFSLGTIEPGGVRHIPINLADLFPFQGPPDHGR